MRICFISHYAHLYGANRSLLALIQGLREHGTRPYVLTPQYGEFTNVLTTLGVSAAVFPIRWWVSPRRSMPHAAWRLYKNLLLLRPLAKLLSEWRIDVVYTNSGVTPIGGMLGRYMRLPHVWHFREFIDLDYGLTHDWGLSTFRWAAKRADARIANSRALRKHLLSDLDGADTHVIYNGVASVAKLLALRDQNRCERREDVPFTFALVGLIQPSKGQEAAIRAFSTVAAKHEAVRLLVVGGGDEAHVHACKALARQLGVESKIFFYGYLPDPDSAYSAADAVLMCSPHEAMGRVTAEAMAACRAVIGLNSAGTAEIISDGYTGFLYDDQAGLVRCMLRLVENPALARTLGENAWHEAHAKYSSENYAAQVFEVVSSVLR